MDQKTESTPIHSEMIRSLRDKRFCYQRNFHPHLPFTSYQMSRFAAPLSMRSAELAHDGIFVCAQEGFALRFKPLEQRYDSDNDRHMINDVADDPQYANVVTRMRKRIESKCSNFLSE